MELHVDRFFSAPNGWKGARVFLAGSFAFLGLYVYFEVLYGSGDTTALVLGVAQGLAGVAELLSERRQRWVNSLRVAAIATLLFVLVQALFRLLA